MNNSMRMRLRFVVVRSMLWRVRLRVACASSCGVCVLCVCKDEFARLQMCFRVEQCENKIFFIFIYRFFIFFFNFFFLFFLFVFFRFGVHLKEASRFESVYERDYSDVRRLHQTNQEKLYMALTIRTSNVDDVIAAFAKNDIMISHMTKLRAAEGEFTKGMETGRRLLHLPIHRFIGLDAQDSISSQGAGDMGRGMRAPGSMIDVEDALYYQSAT